MNNVKRNKYFANSVSFLSSDENIFVGRKAGAYLEKDLRQAKKSIKVISPYLSRENLEFLINAKVKKGVEVGLITVKPRDASRPPAFNPWIIRQIIQQEVIEDKDKKYLVKRFHAKKKWFWVWAVILFLITIGLFIWSFMADSDPLLVAAGIMALATTLLGLTGLILKMLANGIRIKDYKYSQLFPFKIFHEPERNGDSRKFFIHSKVYLIDNKVAHLGSLNMTISGFSYNFESRVVIRDPEVIKGLDMMFWKLFADNSNESMTIDDLKKGVFYEPRQ